MLIVFGPSLQMGYAITSSQQVGKSHNFFCLFTQHNKMNTFLHIGRVKPNENTFLNNK